MSDWERWSSDVNRRLDRIERWITLSEPKPDQKTLPGVVAQAVREYVQRELEKGPEL